MRVGEGELGDDSAERHRLGAVVGSGTVMRAERRAEQDQCGGDGGPCAHELTSGTVTPRLCREVSGPLQRHFAEQGDGFQPAAPGSFLKSELVKYGRVKYTGSSTLVVIVSHWSLLGSVCSSQYSVTVARLL